MWKKTEAKKNSCENGTIWRNHINCARGLYGIVSTPLSHFKQLKRRIFLKEQRYFIESARGAVGYCHNTAQSTNGVKKIRLNLHKVKVIKIIKCHKTLFSLPCDGVP